jgi:chromate reductase
VIILAISGSLRASSTNTAALEAASRLAPDCVEVRLWRGIGDLPLFNPDLESGAPIASVEALRDALRSAAAVLICSPEYAHGISGVMKNALDWVVGSGELIDKPVALINASPYATIAHAALMETLRTMSARVIPDACVTLPVSSGKPGVEEMLASPEISAQLRNSLTALAAHSAKSISSPAAR